MPRTREHPEWQDKPEGESAPSTGESTAVPTAVPMESAKIAELEKQLANERERVAKLEKFKTDALSNMEKENSTAKARAESLLYNWEGVNYELPVFSLKATKRAIEAGANDDPLNAEILANVSASVSADGRAYSVRLKFVNGRCVTNDGAAARALYASAKGISVRELPPK